MAAAVAAAVGRDFEALQTASMGSGLGLEGLFLAMAALSVWDYALLFIIVGTIWLSYILEFHIVGDILRGLKGDAVGLYFDPKSHVSARLVAKCEILKQRVWTTPWLCSPHLQTLFLHFFGRSPHVEYQRQLYITSDGGTIALDWVKTPIFIEEGNGENMRKNPAMDETPTAIIVPGLTSDSYNHYVKHVARSFSDKGWRVLVANHRGLGGVSITSDQFYNAGWTEDLRKIILLVQQTYPKSPLFGVGTSIGANILVKYLGEEGSKTPLGGAVAICCPWDLLLCDRFIRRGAVQAVYSKALVTGLSEYAAMHQTTLSRLVDWSLVEKVASVRGFDDTITRHVGKYETVDTYYRRCSSAQFIESIAIPLLCVSAKDDPICTKEAIPYDECRVNPNVILGVTPHGGHLAYYEGLDATSIWWVRASTEFARVLLSSSLMHQRNNAQSTKLESNIDKGPFLTMTEGLQVAAQDSGYDEDFIAVAQENKGQLLGPNAEVAEREDISIIDEIPDVILEESVKSGPSLTEDTGNCIMNDDFGGPLYKPVIQKFEAESCKAIGPDEAPGANNTGAQSISTFVQSEGQRSVTLQFRSASEVTALRSALSQLLDQVPVPSATMEVAPRNGSRHCQAIEVPISGSVVSELGNCVEATKDLLESSMDERSVVSSKQHRQNQPSHTKEEASGHVNLKKDLAILASQNRRTLWLITYVALVTTFPVLGSAMLVRTRGKLKDILQRRWVQSIRSLPGSLPRVGGLS